MPDETLSVTQLVVEATTADPATLSVTQLTAETAENRLSPLYTTHLAVETGINRVFRLYTSQLVVETIIGRAIPVPSTPDRIIPVGTRTIRRMRQSPHLSDEQVTLFFAQFQLDFEAGTPREGLE
jgi:hypothetical protein